jgi:hypothetical protein
MLEVDPCELTDRHIPFLHLTDLMAKRPLDHGPHERQHLASHRPNGGMIEENENPI